MSTYERVADLPLEITDYVLEGRSTTVSSGFERITTTMRLQLLEKVRGLELVELPKAEECCGFGGTFAVKNADTSIAMLTDKLSNIRSTQAEICTALDNSCLMHIAGGLSRERSGRRTVHLAEILASVEGEVSP